MLQKKSAAAHVFFSLSLLCFILLVIVIVWILNSTHCIWFRTLGCEWCWELHNSWFGHWLILYLEHAVANLSSYSMSAILPAWAFLLFMYVPFFVYILLCNFALWLLTIFGNIYVAIVIKSLRWVTTNLLELFSYLFDYLRSFYNKVVDWLVFSLKKCFGKTNLLICRFFNSINVLSIDFWRNYTSLHNWLVKFH